MPFHTHEVYTPLGGVGVDQTAAVVQISKLPATRQPAQGTATCHRDHLFIATCPGLPRNVTCSPGLLVERGRCQRISRPLHNRIHHPIPTEIWARTEEALAYIDFPVSSEATS